MSTHKSNPPVARWKLTSRQMQLAADFIASPAATGRSRRGYERGWRNALAYDAFLAKDSPSDEGEKAQYARELRRLSFKISPANRQAAAPVRRVILRTALRHLRACGSVKHFNIKRFAKQIQADGTAVRIRRKTGAGWVLTDHAIRAILKKYLGIVF